MHGLSRRITLIVALSALIAPYASSAQQSPIIKGSATLKREAKITGDSAIAIARSAVPAAQVQSVELEREKGKLIYSFDMKTAGKDGIDEINIDAMTGKILSREHEDAKAEAREARAERAHKAKKPTPAR